MFKTQKHCKNNSQVKNLTGLWIMAWAEEQADTEDLKSAQPDEQLGMADKGR